MKIKSKITSFEIAVFFRQFSTMLTAGIPIAHACQLLELSQTNPALITLTTSIKKNLHAGQPLSACLRQHTNQINMLICQLIYLSEQTGTLDNMLTFIADHLEESFLLTRKIKQALFYPTVIFCAGILVTLIMLIFIIPHFEILFSDAKSQKLPLLTRIIFLSSDIIRASFIPLTASLLIIASYLYWQRSISLKSIINQLITNTPILNKFWRQIVLLRFCRNLTITIAAGMAITKSLSLSAHASGDSQFAALIEKINLKIQAGQPLHKALHTCSYFSPLVIGLIKTW